MTSPWVQNENVNAGKMYDRTTAQLLALQAAPTVPPFTDIPLASTITSASTPVPGVARDGFTVVLAGSIQSTGTWAANTTYTAVATLPTGFRTSRVKRVPALNNSAAAVARLQLNANGTIDLLTGATAPASVDLSALSGYIAEA